jgi:hypothetical protein
VQRADANYFGRYIEECIRSISLDEVAQAAEKNEPVALIICSNPYRRQIEEHLTKVGLIPAKQQVQRPERERGLQILSEDRESNLGWRIAFSHSTFFMTLPSVLITLRVGAPPKLARRRLA